MVPQIDVGKAIGQVRREWDGSCAATGLRYKHEPVEVIALSIWVDANLSAREDLCFAGDGVELVWENDLKVDRRHFGPKGLLAVLLLAPVIAGCGSISDFSLKDQEWFSRPGKMFGARSLSIETPPLSVDKPVTPNDLISADGACPGVATSGAPTDANAMQDTKQGEAELTQPMGSVALGHTECDIARAIGAPDSVNLSNNQRGDRLAVLTYLGGPRPGIYTFTAGRLSSIERAPTPEPAKPSRSRKPRSG